jgi:hypothetical protein
VQSLTRIVAHNESWVPKAVNVINLATQMMNGQFKSEQQEQQQADDAAAEDQEQQQQQQQEQRVLVFQPLKVRGCAGLQLNSSSAAAHVCRSNRRVELRRNMVCCSVCSCLTGPELILSCLLLETSAGCSIAF